VDASKRSAMIAPIAVLVGLVLGGCSLVSKELDEHTSRARDIAEKAREMAEAERRRETRGGPHGRDDRAHVDEPYEDDPYLVDTPGRAAIGGHGGFVGGRSYIERGPGDIACMSCDELGSSGRGTESGRAAGDGYSSRDGY